jgi:hypothetical protein
MGLVFHFVSLIARKTTVCVWTIWLCPQPRLSFIDRFPLYPTQKNILKLILYHKIGFGSVIKAFLFLGSSSNKSSSTNLLQNLNGA